MSVCKHDCTLSSKIKRAISRYSNANEKLHTLPCETCNRPLKARLGANERHIFLQNSLTNSRENYDVKVYSSESADEYCHDVTTSDEFTLPKNYHIHTLLPPHYTHLDVVTTSDEFTLPKNYHIHTLLPPHEFGFRRQPTGLEIYLKRLYESRRVSGENQTDLKKWKCSKCSCLCNKNVRHQRKNCMFLESRKFCCCGAPSEESQRIECVPNCGKHTESRGCHPCASCTKHESVGKCRHHGCICKGAVESMVNFPSCALYFKCCDLPRVTSGSCCRTLRPLELSLLKPQGWEWSSISSRPVIILRARSPFGTLPPVWTRKLILKPSCVMRPMSRRNWDPLLYSD
ncbi:hypothetical protein C0J52_17677 [Blattella germanica]|nr:hypothetical protein C0J52_17677 [Blattella germanica]